MAICYQQQGGAAEACWAHNPVVGRSKLPPAKLVKYKKKMTVLAFAAHSTKVSCYDPANMFLLPRVGRCSGSAKRKSHRGREMETISASSMKKHLMYLQMQFCQYTQLKQKLGLKKIIFVLVLNHIAIFWARKRPSPR